MIAIVLAALISVGRPGPAAAQGCYRFSFGAWQPPLQWAAAGHRTTPSGVLPGAPGGHGKLALEDSAAPGELSLTIFPAWWPAGVIIRLRQPPSAGDTVSGTATAYVADGRITAPTTVVRAWLGECRNPRGEGRGARGE